MNALRARWQKEQFEPGWLGLMVNPFYFARRGLLRELRELLLELKGEVLDVGCGRKPYRALVPAMRYVGVDVDTPVTRELAVADVFYDGRTLPFADASFDGALCSQVLEHVFTPEEFLREIRRVLRPGGRLVLTVPFAWDEHEQPHDFARYSSFGLCALLERNGFAVVRQRKSMADARAVMQLASAWLFKATRTRGRALNLFAQLVLIAPVNILGALAGALLPRNEDFYLDNVVLARRRDDRP
jgi:SAM-dependent methyltransferase